MFSCYLNERRSAEEETKHVGHDVVADHTGNGNDEPIQRGKNPEIYHLNHCREKQDELIRVQLDEWHRHGLDGSPDHPLEQVVDDEVGLGHYDQQSHMGPAKLRTEQEEL